MIAKLFHTSEEPVVLHEALQTTFLGIVHPASAPDAVVHQYRGIKYAHIPARFRQSKLCTSYPPQTDATRYGPICPQPQHRGVDEELLGIAKDAIPQQVLKQNEFECLNLNITCPADATPTSHLPVMLWIHGGSGSGSNWLFDGGSLVQKSMHIGKPVILVTFNYRLGLLGFAASPALREDNRAAGDEGVGNYGLRDQRKAMEWVYNFISAFGGDPTNITLFGESSGAADILCHLHSAANETNPLFQRSIVQSASMDFNVPNVHTAGSQLSRIVSSLKVHSVEGLRAADAVKLAALGANLRAVDDGHFFRSDWTGSIIHDSGEEHMSHHHLLGHPHVEEESLLAQVHGRPHHRHSPYPHRPQSRSRSRVRRHHTMHQPLMIGDCGAESSPWSLQASMWCPVGVVKRVRAVCQSLLKSNALLRAYDITPYTPACELPERILELINDARFAWPIDKIATAARHELGGKGVYRYVFDQEGPSKGLPHHAVDLIYLFDNIPLPSLPPSPCMNTDTPHFFYGADSDSDSDANFPFRGSSGDDSSSSQQTESATSQDNEDPESDDGDFAAYDADWAMPVVDEYTYQRVRDAVQERWIAFAHGEAPWKDDKVYVFGPEGEVGERSASILDSRRRTGAWKEALEPLGIQLVQKVGLELSNGPPMPSKGMF